MAKVWTALGEKGQEKKGKGGGIRRFYVCQRLFSPENEKTAFVFLASNRPNLREAKGVGNVCVFIPCKNGTHIIILSRSLCVSSSSPRDVAPKIPRRTCSFFSTRNKPGDWLA